MTKEKKEYVKECLACVGVDIGNKNQDSFLMQCYACGSMKNLCLHAVRRLDRNKISGWIVFCDKCSGEHLPMRDFVLESQLEQVKKWDEGTEKAIGNIIDDCLVDMKNIKEERPVIIAEMMKLVRDDRKHQEAEMLKQLPSVGEIREIISRRVEYRYLPGEDSFMIGSPKALSKAIHDFIKEKLEEK